MIRLSNIRFIPVGFHYIGLSVLFCLFFVIRPYQICAQATIGARSLAMGLTSTALTNDNWAVFGNPSLMKTNKYTFSFYGMRYSGFTELTDLAASATFNIENGIIGVGFHRYGFELFNESRFRLGYRNGFEGFNYGLAVNYNHISQGGNYGSAGAIGLDIGIGAELGNRLLLAAKTSNLNKPAYGDSGEELYRDLAVGLSYYIDRQFNTIIELVKDIRFPLSIRSGFEVHLIPSFCLRAGITIEPLTWSFGIGFHSESISVNLAVQNHEILGLSPGLDFGTGL
jgi:hypothetical protein